MLIDLELEPIEVSLDLDAWRETLRELADVPEIRAAILDQLLNTIGEGRRSELTDKALHHAILAGPGASRGRGK